MRSTVEVSKRSSPKLRAPNQPYMTTFIAGSLCDRMRVRSACPTFASRRFKTSPQASSRLPSFASAAACRALTASYAAASCARRPIEAARSSASRKPFAESGSSVRSAFSGSGHSMNRTDPSATRSAASASEIASSPANATWNAVLRRQYDGSAPARSGCTPALKPGWNETASSPAAADAVSTSARRCGVDARSTAMRSFVAEGSETRQRRYAPSAPAAMSATKGLALAGSASIAFSTAARQRPPTGMTKSA